MLVLALEISMITTAANLRPGSFLHQTRIVRGERCAMHITGEREAPKDYSLKTKEREFHQHQVSYNRVVRALRKKGRHTEGVPW